MISRPQQATNNGTTISFEEEWAQIRAEAAAAHHHDTRMRLNSSTMGKPGILQVSPGTLTTHADTVHRDFSAADDAAMRETVQAPSGLRGFKSATAFNAFERRWKDQMAYLQGLLEHGVAGALRKAAADFSAKDGTEAKRFTPGGKDAVVGG